MENKISLQISTLRLHVESRKLNSHTFSQHLFKTQSNMSGSSVWDMSRIHPLKRKIEQLTAFTFHVGTHCALCFGTSPFFSWRLVFYELNKTSHKADEWLFFPPYSDSGSYQKNIVHYPPRCHLLVLKLSSTSVSLLFYLIYQHNITIIGLFKEHLRHLRCRDISQWLKSNGL